MTAARTIRTVERTTPTGTLIGLVCEGSHSFQLWAENVAELQTLLTEAFKTLQSYEDTKSIRRIAEEANAKALTDAGF